MDTLVGAGYGLADLWAMTPDQLELFATYASKRLAEQSVQDATLTAIGASVGFSGKDKPLKELAKGLGVNLGGRDAGGSFREFAARVAASGDARKEDSRTKGPAERPKLPGPLRLPRG